MTGLTVTDAKVRFGELTAVDRVDLTVEPGEILALIGPSGCGKSTLLRFIAGLEGGSGTVRWGGEDLSRTRPDRRRFGLMFQDHALFPNRDVAGNIAFGLRGDGSTRSARATRVDEMLALVGLDGYGPRPVDTLSGGEAQRVALARALAPSPRLLMLDEPFGSLDRTLRERLTADVRRILVDTGVAAVHVTHDQEEAYAIADRLAVMRNGRIEREGPTAEVWADPRSLFTARFLGHRNILEPGRLDRLGVDVSHLTGTGGPFDRVTVREAAISIVADHRDACGPPPDRPTFPARVTAVRFQGTTSRVELLVDDIVLHLHTPRPPEVGSTVTVAIDPGEIAPLVDDRSEPAAP